MKISVQMRTARGALCDEVVEATDAAAALRLMLDKHAAHLAAHPHAHLSAVAGPFEQIKAGTERSGA